MVENGLPTPQRPSRVAQKSEPLSCLRSIIASTSCWYVFRTAIVSHSIPWTEARVTLLGGDVLVPSRWGDRVQHYAGFADSGVARVLAWSDLEMGHSSLFF